MSWRINFLFLIFLLGVSGVIARLFYLQIILREKFKAEGESQYLLNLTVPAFRGKIFASDGYPLVNNQPAFLLYAEVPNLKDKANEIAKKLASSSEDIPEKEIEKRLSYPNLVWVPLANKLDEKIKEKITGLNIAGLGFEKQEKRYYPEASFSAHLLGFVGSDREGKDKGYFGLEGFYDRELRGRDGLRRLEKDASGRPIILGKIKEKETENGRDLILYLDRTVQFIAEKKLKEGLSKYQAKAGSVVILEPKTGGILAMAGFPNYDPSKFKEFPKESYKNPIAADSYEPGSTFKVLVMAAALNENLVSANSLYEETGPVKVADYQIRTWNNKYHGKITMTQVLEKSSNVGMVYVGKKLGKERLSAYLGKFDIGKPTGIDLEEEASVPLKKEGISEIDLATMSFGQGIAVTGIQMVKAVAAVANAGKLMEPHAVWKVVDYNGKVMETKPKLIRNVIKPTTARILTEMMVAAVDNGEARWAKPYGYRIAGKTGTAQIPLEGHYDKEKTIVSFVGFAPADEPKFVMLVTLREPVSSPWGSETAAPLWFEIAKELFTYYGIGPS